MSSRVLVQVTVDKPLLRWVRAQAESSGLSVSSWLRMILVKLHKEAHEANPGIQKGQNDAQ